MRVLVSAIIAVLVAGCGSADEPAPEPEHATSSPSDAPPPMPRAAKDDTDSGAIAFTKHYVDVLNYAAVTGDTVELKRLSSPKCEGCQEYIDLYEETYESGGYFKGGEWELSNIEVQEDKKLARVFAHMESNAASYKADSKSSEVRGNDEDVELVFELDRSSKSPEVTKLVRNKQ